MAAPLLKSTVPNETTKAVPTAWTLAPLSNVTAPPSTVVPPLTL